MKRFGQKLNRTLPGRGEKGAGVIVAPYQLAFQPVEPGVLANAPTED